MTRATRSALRAAIVTIGGQDEHAAARTVLPTGSGSEEPFTAITIHRPAAATPDDTHRNTHGPTALTRAQHPSRTDRRTSQPGRSFIHDKKPDMPH
jgi:hypothetical protein